MARNDDRHRRISGERQALSWSQNREGRRLAIASGYLRSYLNDHPEDLGAVVIVAVEAATSAGTES